MQYRRDIDGLRALAVVPVIFFHAGFPLFSGGFVGVDVFFVISGYLITSIIASDLREGRFSIATFYERRARRILPALFLVILCCVPVAWYVLLPADWESFLRSVAAVMLFSSNFLFWAESGYFETATELKPLLHTWSLAVEEQFYIFFPLLMLVLWRFGVRVVVIVIASLTVLSLAVSQFAVLYRPSSAFYLLPFRAWELAVGSLLALNAFQMPSLLRARWVAEAACGTGLLLILGSVFLYSKNTPFPGFYALPPVVGTALIIQFGSQDCWIRRLLASRPLVGVGLISYSAYLWHQPLFAFARHYSYHEPAMAVFLALTVVSLLLAYLSWRYVEAPFRDRRRVSRTSIFRAAAVASGVVLCASAGASLIVQDPISSPKQSIGGRCNFDRERCYELPAAEVTVALWGDSYADAIAGSIGEALNQRGASLMLAIRKSCPSIIGILRNEPERLGAAFAERCAAHNEAALRHLLATPVDYVVLTSAYEWYLTGQGEGGAPIVVDAEDASAQPQQFVPSRLDETVDRLTDAGMSVILITPHPQIKNHLALRKALHRDEPLAPEIAVETAAEARALLLGYLMPSGSEERLQEIDGMTLFCDQGLCQPFDSQGRLLLHDGSHASTVLAQTIAERVAALTRSLSLDQSPVPVSGPSIMPLELR